MSSLTGTEAHKARWDELRRAARGLGQAAGLITEAHGILDRFCSSSDQHNWDKAFAWRVSELKQAVSACREIEGHIAASADQATAGDT